MGSSIVGSGAGVAYSQWRQTIDDTARAFSAHIEPTSTDSKTWAKRVVVSAEAAGMRVRWDGSTPTATAGHAFTNGDVLVLEGHENIANFKVIRTGGVSGTIEITAER